jgi:hypothetical protein
VIRVNGQEVARSAVLSAATTFRGQPFEIGDVFAVRIDVRVTGDPVRLEAVRIDPV